MWAKWGPTGEPEVNLILGTPVQFRAAPFWVYKKRENVMNHMMHLQHLEKMAEWATGGFNMAPMTGIPDAMAMEMKDCPECQEYLADEDSPH